MITNILKEKDIRLLPEVCVTIPVIVGNTGVGAGSDGKKIIKAGTPIGSTTNVFENRQTVLNITNSANSSSSAASDGRNSYGVIFEDVDVTSGNVNTTMIVQGFVDLEKIGITVAEDAKTALKHIIFMKGAK